MGLHTYFPSEKSEEVAHVISHCDLYKYGVTACFPSGDVQSGVQHRLGVRDQSTVVRHQHYGINFVFDMSMDTDW